MTTRPTAKEKADILWVKAQSINQLVNAGFTPDSVKTALVKNDFNFLIAKGEK